MSFHNPLRYMLILHNTFIFYLQLKRMMILMILMTTVSQLRKNQKSQFLPSEAGAVAATALVDAVVEPHQLP